MKRLVALAAVSVLLLVACGGGSDDDTDPLAGGGAQTGVGGSDDHTDHGGNATSTCNPSGSAITLTASNTKFDKDCLAVPASQAFTINFDNKDQVTHNIQILESHTASEALFDAGLLPNGAKSLSVPALKAGNFAFHCKIHPSQMSGSFVVK